MTCSDDKQSGVILRDLNECFQKNITFTRWRGRGEEWQPFEVRGFPTVAPIAGFGYVATAPPGVVPDAV